VQNGVQADLFSSGHQTLTVRPKPEHANYSMPNRVARFRWTEMPKITKKLHIKICQIASNVAKQAEIGQGCQF